MKAGQAIIFSSMVCHASYGNNTDRSRLAIGGRYTTPDVKVYDGFSVDHVSTQAGNLEFPINKLSCFIVRREDLFIATKGLISNKPNFDYNRCHGSVLGSLGN